MIGDFNGHSTTWGYTSTANEGETVEQWADSAILHSSMMLNCRSHSTVRDRRKGYNPDLIFASESIANMCKKSIMDPIPHTQHHSICVSVQPVVVPKPTPSGDASTLERWIGMATQQNSITALKTLNPSHPTKTVL